MIRRALPALTLAIVAGCGGSVDVRSDPSPSTSTAPEATPTATVPAGLDPAAAEALRKLTEKAAREQQRKLTGPALGYDVSWPQCPLGMGIPDKQSLGLPMPRDDAAYVVVGLTSGPGFTANPCLAEQVQWVRARKLPLAAYSVASFPDAATLAQHGTLEKVGLAQASFNIANLRRVGMRPPLIWIDVEPVPHFDWSEDLAANAAVVRGLARGYVDAGYRIGVYSTPSLWRRVVGQLRLGVPEWRAAGNTSQAEATRRCAPDWSIQGGEAVLGQWVEEQRDRDITCPSVTDLGPWFDVTAGYER